MKRVNRRLLLTGAGLALGLTRSEVRYKVQKGEIQGWVYDELGMDLIAYSPLTGARHPAIYIYEDTIRKIEGFNVDALPALVKPIPKGKLVLKNGAASLLGRTSEWLQDRAEKGAINAYVYDQHGVNLLSLADKHKENEERSKNRELALVNARVLHFREADVIAYRMRIAEYQASERIPRRFPSLTDQQVELALSMAQEQQARDGYVVTTRIRDALGLSRQYNQALRNLRLQYNWPLQYPTASQSRTKQG